VSNYTAEQQTAIDAFAAGKTIVLDAFAGTGKTTTLKGMAKATPERKGLYLAYNKAIQLDAEGSFPSNTACKTAHSLAYGGMMRVNQPIMNKLRTNKRMPSWEVAKVLGIPAQGFQHESGFMMSQKACASSAMTSVRNFCNSAATEVERSHAEWLGLGNDVQDEFSVFITPFARKAWADITSAAGRLPFAHDHYLKMWTLTEPRLRYDFILFDEAQDANPCIAKLVQSQAAHGTQIVMVGDRNQAIYGWRGAVDAMSKFEADEHLLISQSFRFGPAVAAEANKWLSLLSAPGQVKGFEQIDSKVAPLAEPNAILCRTNATAIAETMAAMGQGKRVALVGGTKEIERFVKAADKLRNGGATEHEDLIAFKDWSEVLAYVQEAEGKDLKVMVNMIEEYGVDAILDVCNASVNEDDADIVISTAHKSKGREWDHVRIANDFKAPEEGNLPSKAEMMLAYVAVTRAKLTLDNAGLSWVSALVDDATAGMFDITEVTTLPHIADEPGEEIAPEPMPLITIPVPQKRLNDSEDIPF
jgi:hypothetical protein